jgi:arylsulfatase
LFFKDGKLHYVDNSSASATSSPGFQISPPPASTSSVWSSRKKGFDEERQPTGTPKLFVADEQVAEGPMRVMLLPSALCGEGLSIRYDGGDPVSGEYPHRLEFEGGRVVNVVFDVADEPYGDVETRLAALVARD